LYIFVCDYVHIIETDNRERGTEGHEILVMFFRKFRGLNKICKCSDFWCSRNVK